MRVGARPIASPPIAAARPRHRFAHGKGEKDADGDPGADRDTRDRRRGWQTGREGSAAPVGHRPESEQRRNE